MKWNETKLMADAATEWEIKSMNYAQRNAKQINEIISKSSKVKWDDYFGRNYSTMAERNMCARNKHRHNSMYIDEQLLQQNKQTKHTLTQLLTQNGTK